MTLPRRRFLHLTAGAAALPAVSRIAQAASAAWPRMASATCGVLPTAQSLDYAAN